MNNQFRNHNLKQNRYGGNMGKDDKGKIEIEIIINGKSEGKMQFPPGIKLMGLRAEVLEKTGNVGQPPDKWDMKDPTGNLLDPNKHLRDYPGLTQIWFTPQVGVGG